METAPYDDKKTMEYIDKETEKVMDLFERVGAEQNKH